MTSKRSNTASAKGRDIAPGVPAQKGSVMEEVVRSVPDGLSPFGSSQQAVSPVPASIPSATAWSFAWSDAELEERAVELVRSMAAVKCRNKYPVGVIGKESRAHYAEARIIAQAIEARRAETQSGSVADESAVAKPCAQGESA